jgi:alpha-D-ribose 1-methylphosphonate 5-triphosphate synthase subunit PhnH
LAHEGGRLNDMNLTICETYTQKAFRTIMQAMSRPGAVHRMDLREGDTPYVPVLRTVAVPRSTRIEVA